MRDDSGNGTEVEARSTGAYSLITVQPLGHDADPGQPVTQGHVAWLASRGLWSNVAELVSLKADDAGNRSALRAAMQGAARFPAPAAPQSLWTLLALLRVLGVHADVGAAGRHVALRLRPETDAEALAASHGRVSKPDTVHYRTEEPTPGGLFSPDVFGADALRERYRFGHIELTQPIVPPLWRAAPRPALAKMLRTEFDGTEGLVTGRHRLVRRPDGSVGTADWAWDSAAPGHSSAGEEEAESFADAIAKLLQSLPVGARPPFGVEGFVRRIVLVPPPALRPLIKHEGVWVTSDVNELLRLVINRNHRLRKLTELEAPRVVVLNERRMLQFYTDALLSTGLADEAGEGEADDGDEQRAPERRRLADVLTLVLGAFTSAATKHVDYSGRAAGVMDRNLPGDTAVVPGRIFDELGLAPTVPVLLTHPDEGTSGAFVALYPRRGGDRRVHLPLRAFDRLGPAVAGEPLWCAVHRPLTPGAVAEAASLLHAVPDPTPVPPSSWIDSDDHDVVLAGVLGAILDGRDVALNSGRGLLLGGTGATHWSDQPG